MGSTFDNLCHLQLIPDYPSHLKNNIHYECIMGSVAYGVSSNTSDIDIYGFSIPPKHMIFPYSYGKIRGFGKKPETFDQFQKHHIYNKGTDQDYDISIYNIVKFFNLCMENNPNMIDALFVPTRCILHSTAIGNHVRDNRKLFLSKRVWHKFKGYAHSQLHKMKNKFAKEFCNICSEHDLDPYAPLEDLLSGVSSALYRHHQDAIVELVGRLESNGKRSKRLTTIMENGYDVKFAYHVVRLMDECQQILEEGDLDLTRSRETLKSIRRGEWSEGQVIEYFHNSMTHLEDLYANTDLRHSPDEEAIQTVLMECLEMHYGSLENETKSNARLLNYLQEIQSNVDKAIRQV